MNAEVGMTDTLTGMPCTRGGAEAWIERHYKSTDAQAHAVEIAGSQTEVKRALRAAEERLRLLVEHAPDAIVMYDVKARHFIEANPRAESLFGRPRAQILELGPQDFYATDQPDGQPAQQTVAQHDQEALAGKPLEYERRILKPSGETRLCKVTLVKLPTEEGSLLRASFVDITEEREVELRWRASLEKMIGALANTLEARDPYTAGHQQRVAMLATAIGQKLGMPELARQGLYLASTVHDIGKICLPAEILCKPGKLSKLEFALVQSHAEAGWNILKNIDSPWPIAEIVRQHHERLDGSGYPQGLEGSEILLEARILAVADTIDAMMSHRPYRPALGLEAALAEINNDHPHLYDPKVVDACTALLKQGGFQFSQAGA